MLTKTVVHIVYIYNTSSHCNSLTWHGLCYIMLIQAMLDGFVYSQPRSVTHQDKTTHTCRRTSATQHMSIKLSATQ